MQTISIISLKGGVAKTTTAVNMAYTLAAVHNKKVLIIDNDKQGNTSKAFKKYDTEDKNTVARMMLERNIDVSEIIKKTDYENIDIITANMDLLEANLRTIVDTGRQQQTRFKKALSNSKVLDHGWAKFDYLPLTEAYDYCIIDNAPDINMSIINALVTSNDVIVPVFMDQYSFDGLRHLRIKRALQSEKIHTKQGGKITMTTEQKTFIENIAAAARKHAANYGIAVISPIIAQAINESGWGKSTLAAKYHNYFGMKCGSAWKGKSVNMSTCEEYEVGVLTQIKDNFRVYDSLEEGVKGYFDFISASRYANLKGVTDPKTYIENIKADGYATSSQYVKNLLNLVSAYNLTQYDNITAQQGKKSVAEIAQEVIAGAWGNGTERKEKLEAAGYNYAEVQAIVNERAGNKTENKVDNKKSIAEIAQEVVAGKWGNGSERKQRLEAEGYDYAEVQATVNNIMGKSQPNKKNVAEIANEVISGKWGNGSERKEKLEAAGYNYAEVQAKVNEMLR